MRRFFCLLLLICLPLQSFAMQAGHALSDGIVHQIQHDQGVQHHHHDDDSVHYDDSDASEQHAAEHSACSHSVWLPFLHAWTAPAGPLRSLACPETRQFIPDPFLDAPHRPPASSLG